MWVNFYTREHKKAPKSLNVAVGPQRFPQQQKPYLTCLMRAFAVQIERFLDSQFLCLAEELPCPGQCQLCKANFLAMQGDMHPEMSNIYCTIVVGSKY